MEGLSDIPVLEAKKGRDCCMSLITHLQKNCKLLKAEASPEGSPQLRESSQERSSDQSEDKKHKLQGVCVCVCVCVYILHVRTYMHAYVL